MSERCNQLMLQEKEVGFQNPNAWLEFHSVHHSSRYMSFSISLKATPSPAAVLNSEEPVRRNSSWTKDFRLVVASASKVSRPENPRPSRKTCKSAGRLWINTPSSLSEKLAQPVNESWTIFLLTSALTALAKTSVHLPAIVKLYQPAKAKWEARASSTCWKLGSPVG